jgi:peptidyl-prolyl cis-trans isomerase SurA
MKLLTITLLFTATSIAAQNQTKTIGDKIIAIVGDRPIMHSEIKNAVDEARRMDNNVSDTTECMFLKQAIIAKVLMLQAEKDSLPVTEEEVEAELDQRIRYYINVFGSEEALADYAGKPVYKIKADSKPIIKERRLAEAMQQKILGNVRITPIEVKAFFDNIPKDSLPYFESELEIGHITIFPKASRELEQYTIEELNNFKKQIETKVLSFEQLARDYSWHAASKQNGGHFQLNRNDKSWDPAFISTVFRLKEGEISNPVKVERMGYFLIQMIQRRGDEADVKLLLRTPPVTDNELVKAASRLDTVRAKIIAGSMSFNEAAIKYSEYGTTRYQEPFIVNLDGSSHVPIDQLDKSMVTTISKMKTGEISQPVTFTNDEGKKAVRIVYLKSRTDPHRMNFHDDYSRISMMALDKKKADVLNGWLKKMIPAYYITISTGNANGCPLIKEFANLKIIATN